jgi:hypothetical protein
MLLCFSLMGIYWIRIAQIGGFSLEAYHLGLLCLIAVSAVSISTPVAMYRVVLYCAPWFLAYVAFLIVLLPALAGTPAFGLMLKQVLFVTGFLCIAAYFSRAPAPAGTLRRGALCGLGLYLIFTEYSAQLIGKSLAGAVIDFLATGSIRGVIYGFFRPLFNSLKDPSDLAFVASLTNSIAVSLLVLAICYRAGFNKRGVDLTGTALTIVVVLLGILLNARSVVLAALASIVAAAVARRAMARAVSMMEMLYWCVAGAMLASAGFVVTLHHSSAFDAIISAFEFNDNSAESRLQQYAWALGLIEEQLFVGHGYVETESGYPIHNLFLSSWAYTGLFGFVLVVGFYVGLLAMWLHWLYLVLTRHGFWTLNVRPEWVAVLPILPLFRVWISGAGGLPAYGEWIALGVFVGLTLRNEAGRTYRVLGPVRYSAGTRRGGRFSPGPALPAGSSRRYPGRKSEGRIAAGN